MVLGIGVGTALQFADPIFHALAALFTARSGIDGHRRQVVSAHVTVKPVPVGVGLGFWRQSGLFQIGCQQTVIVVLQKGLDVQIASLLQRSVQECHVTKWKLVLVEFVLCSSHH